MKTIILKKITLFFKIGLSISLLILVLGILRINFSFNSEYFNGDMYSDILYSKYAWKCHDIFPDCWIFGNQVYVFATPVIASIFYGFTDNPYIVMGIASSIMAMGVIFSFLWMTKSIFKNKWLSIISLLFLLTLTLFSGDPIYDINGWQLLFTMCSYYACYAIVAFLGFGIYINIENNWKDKKTFYIIILIIECILSFCTGMNSIRQTAIMTIPLLSTELIFAFKRILNKTKLFNIRSYVAFLISASNILGIIFIKSIDIPMNTIYGQIKLKSFNDISAQLFPELYNMISLFGNNISKSVSIVLVILIISFSFFILKQRREEKRIIILLLLFAVCIIYIITVFTTINNRNIYYFMLFPLTSILVTSFFECLNHPILKYFKIVLVSILILTSSILFLQKVPVKKPSHYINYEYNNITNYLLNKDITTVYCPFSFGGKISLDSNLKIQNGFWFTKQTFKKVDYICDSEIFNNSDKNYAYIFTDENMKKEALQIADSKDTEMNLLYYSTKNNIWIYTSSSNNLIY